MKRYKEVNKAWKEMARAVDHLKMDLSASNLSFHSELSEEEGKELIEDLNTIIEKAKGAQRILAISDS